MGHFKKEGSSSLGWSNPFEIGCEISVQDSPLLWNFKPLLKNLSYYDN